MSDPSGPSAAELTERDVSAIRAAADTARVEYEEIRARDPSVSAAGHKWVEERSAVLGRVRDAYVAAGVSQRRAEVATTVWFLTHPTEGPPTGPRDWLAEGDAADVRQPRYTPGGIGQQ